MPFQESITSIIDQSAMKRKTKKARLSLPSNGFTEDRLEASEPDKSVKSIVLPKNIIGKIVNHAEVQEVKLIDDKQSLIDISMLNDSECIVKITGDDESKSDATRKFVEDINNNEPPSSINTSQDQAILTSPIPTESEDIWTSINTEIHDINKDLEETLASWKAS